MKTSNKQKFIYHVIEYYKPFLRKRQIAEEWLLTDLSRAREVLRERRHMIQRLHWYASRYSYELIKEDADGNKSYL